MISLGKKSPRGATAILLRTKDRPVFLRRALESILAQTDEDWVIALVNDGGDRAALDDTLAPFAKRLAGRLAVAHFEKSEGRGKGKHLNMGLKAVDSEFVAIHDDDDSWEPDFLARARAAMGEKAAVVTQSFLIKEKLEGGALSEISREIYEPWQKFEISLFRLAESLTFPPIALLFRRAVISDIGNFDDELGPLEDWEFSLRLFSRFEVKFLEEPLAHYRQREGTGSEGNSRANSARIYGELDQQIRNRLLRQDLADGRVGLGFLVNAAQAHGRVFLELLQQRKS
ncbi:MAG: glycosyltransferase family 2 protein [Bdellovibrionota bacterium]